MEKNVMSLPGLHSGTGIEPALTIQLSSELCYERANEVVSAVRSSLSRSPKEIRLGLGGVTTVDSSGLRALLLSRSMCEAAGVDFGISEVSDCVARIMHMSGLGGVFGVPEVNLDTRTSQSGISLGSNAWKTYEHVATSNPALISVLRERVADAAAEAGVDAETLCDIKIAVGEALTNAYRHGSPRKGSSRILVRCMSCSSALVVEVEDEGRPFDPNATPEPDPEKLRDHGMGIYLMRQAMDVVEFQSNCPGNRVRMIKWLGGRKSS